MDKIERKLYVLGWHIICNHRVWSYIYNKDWSQTSNQLINKDCKFDSYYNPWIVTCEMNLNYISDVIINGSVQGMNLYYIAKNSYSEDGFSDVTFHK